MSINTEKLFQVSSGELYAVTPWRVLRKDYAITHDRIESTLALRSTLRAGPFAWPGGYPLFFIMSDMEAMCFACARKEYRLISRAIRDNSNDGWRVVGCDINYEDPDCRCCHCGELVDPAYADAAEDDEKPTLKPLAGPRPDPDPECEHCDGEGTEIHCGPSGYYDGHCSHCWIHDDVDAARDRERRL